jgi:hypothetical protein
MGLEWFGLPERNTLRPLCDVLLISLGEELPTLRECRPLCVSSNVRAFPFIGSRGVRTLSGAPTGGPGDILNNVHIGALNALDLEIFLVSLRAYPPSGYGLVPSY